jgi:hypothetical protein
LIPGCAASCCISPGVGECLGIRVVRPASWHARIGRSHPERGEPQLKSQSSNNCQYISLSRHGMTRLPVLTR